MISHDIAREHSRGALLYVVTRASSARRRVDMPLRVIRYYGDDY